MKAKASEDSQTKTNQKSMEVDIQNLNDVEITNAGLSKINNALFEYIQEIKRQEITIDHEIIKSRAFSRLQQSGHQLLTAYQKQIASNEELVKQITELEKKHEQSIEEVVKSYKEKQEDFSNQLTGIQTQLKISEIEKENLQREVNNLKLKDTTELEESLNDYKAQTSALDAQNKDLKDELSRAIKEKTSLTDRLNSLRLELDTVQLQMEKYVSGKAEPKDGNQISDNIVDSQSKQIKDLVEECAALNKQIDQQYSDMESIYEANQELENKNKLLSTKAEDSKVQAQKLREESFKKDRIAENCKKEVVHLEYDIKNKTETILKLKEKCSLIEDKLEKAEQISETREKRVDIVEAKAKQYENEIQELNKSNSELKQQIEESDIMIDKVQKELKEKLLNITINYLKTGKTTDPKFTSLDDVDITMLNLQKYKSMVKCPT